MIEQSIRVPLAIDAQVKIPVGPLKLPMRSVLSLVAAVIPALIVMQFSFISSTYRIVAALALMGAGAVLGLPTKEGVWFVTWYIYRHAGRLMPTLLSQGSAKRATVAMTGIGVRTSEIKPRLTLKGRSLKYLDYFTDVPKMEIIGEGIINYRHTGHHAVLLIDGPAMGIQYDGYVIWCEQFCNWLRQVGVPAQVVAMVEHSDTRKAEEAFDNSVQKASAQPALIEMERVFASELVRMSLGLTHYVVLSPGAAGKEGKPPMSRFTGISGAPSASLDDAERALQAGVRLAQGFGIGARPASEEEIKRLGERTIVGADTAAMGDDLLQVGEEHQVLMTMTKLPPTIFSGAVVEALMQSRVRGLVSLHLFQVDTNKARKEIEKRGQMLDYAASKGGGDVGIDLAAGETQQVIAAIAGRNLVPLRVALTISVSDPSQEAALEGAEQVLSQMQGAGFEMELVTCPGFLPALAVSPGGPPLQRSLLLTSEGVASRLLPTLGTPFSNISEPLLGINVATGAPAYFSAWTRDNHNVVVVGSSGSGKSVAAKTLIIRHAMRGATVVVIDPDSEYGPAMEAIHGDYYELGKTSINPLGAGLGKTPDQAAELILPVLSVMAGDEKGIKNGRPIRRLPDEDQGFFHVELAEFFRSWTVEHPEKEPVLSNFIAYLRSETAPQALTEQSKTRLAVVIARLERYTQGRRGDVFDHPSSFGIGDRSVGIGLRYMSMNYGADLTAALAIILTQVLGGMERYPGRIIVVDEAHRVTCDPDAGEVLGQLVRQARKYGSGVWMMSQQVEDFVETDLGKVLANTAATKLIMGVEESSLESVAEVFKLRPEEVRLLNPSRKGRGILLSSAGERSGVMIRPGRYIMDLADTSGVAFRNRLRGDGE